MMAHLSLRAPHFRQKEHVLCSDAGYNYVVTRTPRRQVCHDIQIFFVRPLGLRSFCRSLPVAAASGADAILAASIFHEGSVSIQDAKAALKAAGYETR